MGLAHGHVVAERFEILGLAGAGGMGTVYRARDAVGGGLVALKVVPSQEARRIERWNREARVLAELSHPGLPRYVAHGASAAGERWIAMEWLEGEDLAQRLASDRLSVAESVALTRRATEALAVAHAAGIVHRDIKPSNLFLVGGEAERVKILDFGVARWRRSGREQTRTGVRVGTPRYMAPEQARGAPDVDGRADIFALGCVLFLCLTGRHAFTGDDELEVLAKILLESAPRPSELAPGLSREIDRLLGRMLAKDPDARPRDCAELALELSSLGAPAGDPPPTAAALGEREQRLLSVVAVGAGSSRSVSERTPNVGPPRPALAATDDTQPLMRNGELDPVEATVARFGARAERMADGSVIAVLTGVGAASDQAAQAARLALTLRPLFPRAAVAVATGRGVVGEASPVGEVIERVARLVRLEEADARGAPGVRLCGVTAGLLGARFEVAGNGQLIAERGRAEAPRTLLGRATPLIGRELEMALLRGVYAQCVAEPVARAVVITAEPGVGKSRLRHELTRELARAPEAPEIWESEGDQARAGSPYALLAPALRRAAGILEGESTGTRRAKLMARVARHLPPASVARTGEFLGELVGVPFPDESSVQLRAARQDPILMGDQLVRAFADLVLAETVARPLVIILDDLHWGDLPTVRLLDAALRAAHDRPLMVLAFGRPELDGIFPRLWEGRRITRLELGELSRKGSERLVTSVLGEVAAELRAALVERAAGNAFFLEELIRAVAGGGPRAAVPELPATVLAMIHARLEELPPGARRVLRAASVFGDVFRRGGLRALLGADGDTADRWLEHLAAHEVITRRLEPGLPGEQEYAFRHVLLREAAYATLTEADRRLGHRLAARFLQRAGETTALVLAEHVDRGGEPGAAAELYLAAAEDALEASDLAAAQARAERGIACGARGETLGRLQLARAEAHNWRGALADAERCAEAALELLPRGGSRWHVAAGQLAGVAGRLGHYQRAEELARALLTTAGAGAAGPLTAEWAVAAARTAITLLFGGRYALGGELVAQLDARAGELARNPAVAAALHRARAIRALSQGDQAAGLTHWPAAIAAHEEAGDLRGACQARGNLANRYKVLGGYAQAQALLEEVTPAAERLGAATVKTLAKQNLGVVLASAGRLDAALATEREAVDELVAQGDHRLEGMSRIYLARILILAGRAADAEVEAEAGTRRLRDTLPAYAQGLATLAEARLALGETSAALADAREAMRVLESLGGLDEGDSIVRLAHARVLRAAGLEDEAHAAAAAARARLLADAARIADPEWRRSFLENVPENRATLELPV